MSAVLARAFLPELDARRYLEAYAACGGYPLHLQAWDPAQPTERNLVRLAGTAGGILFEDAQGILREELPDVGGYPRILAAIGRGRTRISQIADDAAQRVEHPLDVLVTSGFVRRSVPLGAPRRSRPLYEIDDAYLAFWFAVLYSDAALIGGGQGSAVLARRGAQWQKHLGWVFEELARDHARRLVASGRLPEDLVVGKWWSTSGPDVEVDVLGMQGPRSVLVGEARWQGQTLGPRDVAELAAKVPRLPKPSATPQLVLWARGGLGRTARGERVVGYDLEQMLEG